MHLAGYAGLDALTWAWVLNLDDRRFLMFVGEYRLEGLPSCLCELFISE